ncbi:MAG: hypothetical protein V4552_01305 [Pseudomonadota bacterium]
MADNSTTDSKIPVLTEVYQPKIKAERNAEEFKTQASKQNDPTLGITPEFIARVTNHVRPRLEADITQAVLDSVRDALKKDLIKELQAEISKTQAAIESNTTDFIDKTKADLKTDLPRMYQVSAELVHASLADKIAGMQTTAVTQVDRMLTDVMQTSTQAATTEINTYVETLKTDVTARIQLDLNQALQAFQAESLQQHQAQLSNELSNAYETIMQTTQQDLQQQVQTLQSDALTQMRSELDEAMPAIYTAAADEVKAKFIEEMTSQSLQVRESFLSAVNGDLPAVQEVLRANIQHILASALPALENDLRRQLTDELQELLLKVKFVLP